MLRADPAHTPDAPPAANPPPVAVLTVVTLPAGPLAEMVAALAADGYHPGIPRDLSLSSRAADQELCRRMRCPACRRRGMAYRPFVNGRRQYRVVASCPSCNCAEEC